MLRVGDNRNKLVRIDINGEFNCQTNRCHLSIMLIHTYAGILIISVSTIFTSGADATFISPELAGS